MKRQGIVQVRDVSIECDVHDWLAPSILRAFTGTTPLDAEVDRLELPAGPRWLLFSIRSLRWYRHRVSPRLGSRCVFEPSCSRFAEVALRDRGAFLGLFLILRRLLRCRPGYGGVDLP